MTVDPYAVLGLARTATAEDIKRAYRSRSKATHPDAGGNAAAFDRLTRAYDLLSDPARRAKYDATGEIEEKSLRTGDEASWGIVSGMLAQILGADQDPFQLDLVHLLKTALGDEIAKTEKGLAKLRKAEGRAERMAGRFIRKLAKSKGQADAEDGGRNMIEAILAHQRAELGRRIKGAEESLAQRKRARELVEEYDFKADRPPDLYAFGSLYQGAPTNSTAGNSGFNWNPLRP